MNKAVFWIVAILGFFVMIALLTVGYRVIGYPFWLHLLFSMVSGYFFGYFASKTYFNLVE